MSIRTASATASNLLYIEIIHFQHFTFMKTSLKKDINYFNPKCRINAASILGKLLMVTVVPTYRVFNGFTGIYDFFLDTERTVIME